MRVTSRSWHRRARTAAVLGIAATLTLAACGGDEDAASGDDDGLLDGASASPESLSGTVQVWGWNTGPEQADRLLPAFNELYPNIEVQMKAIPFGDYAAALRPALGSDSGPDVFQLQGGALTSQFGQFGEDLSLLAADTLGEDWQDKIAEVGVSAYTIDGELKALAVGLQAAGTLAYNKTLFDEYDLEPPETVSEWVDLCETLASNDVTCFAQGAQDGWVNQDVIQAIANSIAPGKFTQAVENEVPWTDSDLVEAFTVWGELFENGVMQPGALAAPMQPDVINQFLRGDSAMIALGVWAMQYFKGDALETQMEAAGVSDPAAFEVLIMDFPSATDEPVDLELFGGADNGMAVNAKSDNKAAAAAFVQWLALTEEGQQAVTGNLAYQPALKGVAPAALDGLTAPEEQEALFEEYSSRVQSITDPRTIAYPDLVTALGDNLQAIGTGEKTPEQAASDLQAVSEGIDR